MAGLPLVTGATGFAGSHLVDQLIAREPAVAAWANPRGASGRGDDARVTWQAVDLLDRDAVFTAIDELRPGIIYHCAGSASVAESWKDPVRALQVNAMGTHHLLDAVSRTQVRCPVVVTGSAMIYRASAEALGEESPLAPANPYGTSKLAQEMLVLRAREFPVFLARPFNHIGPRQSPAYATSSFAKQIAEIEATGAEPVLRVGDLSMRRDLTDVRDTVRAYRMIAESGRPGRPYNVCRGQAYQIGELLDTMIALARITIRVVVDPDRLRPAEHPLLLGDPSRIASEVGWEATIPLAETLRDLLDYWRHALAVSRA